MTGLVRTSLGASEDVPRTFWALFGLRTVRYRLLGPEGSVLASTLRGEKAPPAEEIYSVRVWAEVEASLARSSRASMCCWPALLPLPAIAVARSNACGALPRLAEATAPH